jgi:hypothetical protein
MNERDTEVLTVFVVAELWRSLSFMDQYLAVWILLAMIAGILIGVYAVGPSASISTTRRFAKASSPPENSLISCLYRRVMSSACSKVLPGRECQSVRCPSVLPPVSPLIDPRIAILIGLLLMMWPILTKVQYERLPYGILDPQYLAAARPLDFPQLGDNTIHYAWARLGDPAREEVVKREAGCDPCGHRAMYR